MIDASVLIIIIIIDSVIKRFSFFPAGVLVDWSTEQVIKVNFLQEAFFDGSCCRKLSVLMFASDLLRRLNLN